MADDLQKRITTMSRDSAIRTARTAVTGAQNAGRMDSYAAAEKMGIKLKKNGWLRWTRVHATLMPCLTANKWRRTRSFLTVVVFPATHKDHRGRYITAAVR